MATKEARVLVKECVELIEYDTKLINRIYEIFYDKLFTVEPKLKSLLSDDKVYLSRKFFNMFSTFKTFKYIDKVSDIILEMGNRHKNYGINERYLSAMKEPLIDSIREVMGQEKFSQYETAWHSVYEEMEDYFKKGMGQKDFPLIKKLPKNIEPDFLEKIGGVEAINRIHVKFYDILFEEPWLGQFFAGKSPKAQVLKQTQFMVMAFGGQMEFKGETPAISHMHMFITDEMIDLRERILRKCILEEGISEELCDKWMEIDHFYGSFLVKRSKEECVLKCMGQAPAMAIKPQFYEPAF